MCAIRLNINKKRKKKKQLQEECSGKCSFFFHKILFWYNKTFDI